MLDLNNLIDSTDPLSGKIAFSRAPGISDADQIVANGCYTSGPLNGQCHAFRLDPVPVFAGNYQHCGLAQDLHQVNGFTND